ncbi:hypothetical protein D3C74_490980 [compost metagenome]
MQRTELAVDIHFDIVTFADGIFVSDEGTHGIIANDAMKSGEIFHIHFYRQTRDRIGPLRCNDM